MGVKWVLWGRGERKGHGCGSGCTCSVLCSVLGDLQAVRRHPLGILVLGAKGVRGVPDFTTKS